MFAKVTHCRDLSARIPNKQPSVYVAYKFYTHADHTTPTIKTSNNPEFANLHLFPVIMDKDMDYYLKTSMLEFIVVDDDDGKA